jgi:hypothetical protein
MLSYDTVKQHPGRFLSCTSFTPDEFTDLLVAFTVAWNDYARRTVSAQRFRVSPPSLTLHWSCHNRV